MRPRTRPVPDAGHLTLEHRQALAFVGAYLRDDGCLPTTRELALACGFGSRRATARCSRIVGQAWPRNGSRERLGGGLSDRLASLLGELRRGLARQCPSLPVAPDVDVDALLATAR